MRIRGESLNRGLVFREFVDLMPVGRDVASGRTVFEEYRLFFWKGRLLKAGAHDDGGGVWEEFARWEEYARRFASPLITIDVARRTDGRWMIVETGDAGVSGLPAVIAPGDFYAALRAVFTCTRSLPTGLPPVPGAYSQRWQASPRAATVD